MLTKDKQLTANQSFLLAAYYAELWKIDPSLSLRLVEAYDDPEYWGGVMFWFERAHLHTPIYQAFQIVARYLSDDNRRDLAHQVSHRVMTHDLRSYWMVTQNPAVSHQVVDLANNTLAYPTDATTAMAEALAGQDWQSFESTVARISERETKALRAFGECDSLFD